MASSPCSSRAVSPDGVLAPPASSRGRPAAAAAAAFFPRRSAVPSSTPKLAPIRPSGERDVRAMVAVRKYKGTRMREKQLAKMIEQKVQEAREACEEDARSDECKVAWDEVEEVSRAKAHLRRRLAEGDPLEPFCRENPDADECRVSED